MKQITRRVLWMFCAIFMGINISSIMAQSSLSCYHGLKFSMSQDAGWGQDKPIIYSVEKYSPAALAGLKVGHIIERIDGISTLGMSVEQLAQLLHSDDSEHILEVTNLIERKTCLLQRYCRPQGSISEQELAQLFYGYSVEDARSISTSYHYLYSRDTISVPNRIWTFSFAQTSSPNEALDKAINANISKYLSLMGFSEQSENPDILIQTDYTLEPLESNNDSPSNDLLYSWHQNVDTGLILPLPILPAGVATDVAKYRISMGLSIVAPKNSKSIIWRAESQDYLASAINLVDYTQYILPTMLARFPMISDQANSNYQLQTLRYYYTGIIYDPNNLGRIMDIDHNSPAFRAGLRIGDQIVSINEHRLDGDNLQQLYATYQHFLSETMEFRDQNYPLYQVSNNERGLAPWDKAFYSRVAKLIQAGRSRAVFSYLFAFRPYIVDAPNVPVVIEIERPGGRYTIELQPELRNMSSAIPIIP